MARKILLLDDRIPKGSFSERLNILRGEMSLREFANKIGCFSSTLHTYLYGKKTHPPTIPTGDFLAKVLKAINVEGNWLLTGEGPMHRKAGNGNGIAEEIRNDPKLNDIFQILKGDRESRDAVYELLVGKKQVERVAKILKKLMAQKIEDLMKAEIKEDPMLVDIIRILAANPSTKHTIYKFLETDMSCARSLEIFKKHFDDKFTEKINPSPGNSAGL